MDDPLTFSDPAYDAAADAYNENLAPPAWFYPLVGEVASDTVLLELCMTEAALELTRTEGDARELIRSSESMLAIIKAAKDLNDQFDALVPRFHTAREDRNRIVHALLSWREADGNEADYWIQHHPKTKREIVLPTDEAPRSMTDALRRIKDVTQQADELTIALRASDSAGQSPNPW
ncbi:hypothetical protein GCU60_17500 [Blastococcus saxobsidens]|uniref:Uncharacterized protein n=1 Tax=Blastococcus saxobsidens TaxID=138336 RepID=A0A6L9W7W3_9ACTN|nr:hypothetical protein [Blastococcus saxobsidens]